MGSWVIGQSGCHATVQLGCQATRPPDSQVAGALPPCVKKSQFHLDI